MHARLALASALLGTFHLNAALTAPVKVEQGSLQGIPGADPSVTVYKGVPYAAPPVGKLRWETPAPAAKWSGVRKADKFASACIQAPQTKGTFYQVEFYPTDEPTSEDCLYLNIYTAAKAPSEKRPVIVWIHGGALREGSGSLLSFGGEPLAMKGVVLVAINYRMNVFGFYAHPELTKASAHHASGNYGFQDQMAALTWVKRNIAVFGGDPNNVTIDGQSAGARSINCIMASPLGKGLFQKVIGESGAEMQTMKTLGEAEAEGVKYAEKLGARSIADLRAIPADRLLKEGGASGPIVDGYVLPASPHKIFSEGKQNDVPMLAGSTLDEQGGMQEPVSAEQFRAGARQTYGAMADPFLKLYPNSTDAETHRSQHDISRDSWSTNMRRWSRMQLATGKNKVWMYCFTRVSPGHNAERYGAFHSGELVYVFNNLKSVDRPWEPIDRKLADTMSSYWVNFAKNGDPNGPGLPEWTPYNPKADVTLELGNEIKPRPRPDAARLDFWDAWLKQQLGI
jgi:para-nitrobenzyl esterase